MLSYGGILRAVSIGRVNGRWYRLPLLTRALIRAALNYSSSGSVIRCREVLKTLMPAIEFLTEGSGINAEHSVVGSPIGSSSRRGGREGPAGLESEPLKQMVLDVLDRLRRRPGARRRVHPLTRALLEAFVKTPLRCVGKALLSTIAKALKAVREELSPRARLVKMGSALAWNISTIAYRWGNREALNWRRDEDFALYWGATILGWPRHIPAPSPKV
jgi:hypothetical protein